MKEDENYTKKQEALKDKYTKEHIPYVVLHWSESQIFPDEERVYTLKEFNEMIKTADSEFHNRKEYAEKKYGSYDKYWELEDAGKIPPEDQGIRFGYDKTKFTIYNIPNLKNPEDTYSYAGDRYDIGDGNGSIFDFIRSTCSYNEIISAMNKIEDDLYFPEITESQKEFVRNVVSENKEKLSSSLEKLHSRLTEAQTEYRKVHESWLIEASKAESVENAVDEILDEIHGTYDSSMTQIFKSVLAEYPFAKSNSQLMSYVKNEAKKMAIEKLYEPSRDSQKAMNQGNYSKMNSFDWNTQRKIWSKFPANVNFDKYVTDLVNQTSKEINASEINGKADARTKYNGKVDFYVADNIEFENESWAGLTAEQAVAKFTELKAQGPNGFFPCIGIDTHDGSIYDSGEEGHGQCIYSGSRIQTDVLDYISHFASMPEYRQAIYDLYSELKAKGYEFSKEDAINVNKMMDGLEENKKEEIKPTEVYTYSPFGYDGSIVSVETDLRRGFPAYDIVGIADSTVKETRERIRSAFKNSNLQMPPERILQSLSPADLRKETPMDLAMAIGILAQTNSFDAERILAIGELELNGKIRPVRGAVAAITNAKSAGIDKVICDPATARLLTDIPGISILAAENLAEVNEKLTSRENFIMNNVEFANKNNVEFNEEPLNQLKASGNDINTIMKGHFETVRAIEVAVAGKHNILTTGAPGCGKTILNQNLIPILTPKLTEEEASTQARIKSLAGIDFPGVDNRIPPFRMPHQTASIEGICGGGPSCHPGEITLANNGTLFLDEAAEFRSSVIQMTRVPIESRSITLSRAGRSTVYPADFQLALAMNPCPCGCYGSHDKICLDSARSIDMYWKKISEPLLDRIEIKNFCQKNENDQRMSTIEAMRNRIKAAYEIQRARGVFNSHMTPLEISQYCKLNKADQKYVDGLELSPRANANLLRVSLTIANMDGREQILTSDIMEANELCAPLFEKPQKYRIEPDNELPPANQKLEDYRIDDATISRKQIKEAEEERRKILNPIYWGDKTDPLVVGNKSELYKAFHEFEEKGVFDIKGTKLDLTNGKLTETGWKQLQAAMEIYRNKKFETFRYVLIDKQGEIKDQLAISSHMPNFCSVSFPKDDTLKQVISRAEEQDLLVAVVHNHPSGNVEASDYDKTLTRILEKSMKPRHGENRFAGHIILDHDSFNLYSVQSGKWETVTPLVVAEKDRLTHEVPPEWAGLGVAGSGALKRVARKINDINNWNDDYIPVAFTNADRNISAIQYFDKNFFEYDSMVVRSTLENSARESGATSAFPVVTDSLWNKLSRENQDHMDTIMKLHVKNNAFTDAAISSYTITEKWNLDPGANFYTDFRSKAGIKPTIDSTWKPEINKNLSSNKEEKKQKKADIER